MCPAAGNLSCDDADPCTDDACVDGVGCENTAKVGIEAVTCTCLYPLPTTCAGDTLSRSIRKNTTRACRLFSAAAESPARRARRQLRQGARALRRAVAKVSRAQLRGLSPECAASLAEQYREAGDRAAALAASITP